MLRFVRLTFVLLGTVDVLMMRMVPFSPTKRVVVKLLFLLVVKVLLIQDRLV